MDEKKDYYFGGLKKIPLESENGAANTEILDSLLNDEELPEDLAIWV